MVVETLVSVGVLVDVEGRARGVAAFAVVGLLVL